MKYFNISYNFVYTTPNTAKLSFFETTISSQFGGEKEATIELIKANNDLLDYFLYEKEVIK